MKSEPHDQLARDQLALLMRALYSNRITNLEFDERAEEFSFRDHAAFQVFQLGAWRTYDDFREQRFTGERALTREGKRTVARWILFLKSGQSYKWPDYPGLNRWVGYVLLLVPVPVAMLLRRWDVLGLGLVAVISLVGFLDSIIARNRRTAFEKAGDFEVWPFFSKSDYEAALKSPPYLLGIDRRS